MGKAVDLLGRLHRQNIVVWVERGRLCYRAPKGSLTPEIRAEMAHLKEDLIQHLKAEAAEGTFGKTPMPARVPLSHGQAGMWFLQELMPQSGLYNGGKALQLSGPLCITTLARAFARVVERHASLRTVFDEIEGEPCQVVQDGMPLDLGVIDYRAHEIELRSLMVETFRKFAGRPFNLRLGPLFRIRLVRLAMDCHLLLLVTHHIISDGWSMDVMVGETAALYHNYLYDKPEPFPEPVLQYGDFAVWMRRRLNGAYLQRLLDFWRSTMADAPEQIAFPSDYPRPAVHRYLGEKLTFDLGTNLSNKLTNFARSMGTTLFTASLAIFKALLFRYLDSRDLVVGTPVAGRPRRELENLIGCFINTLALRTQLTEGETPRSLLARVKGTVTASFEHQDLPFERLVRELRPNRDPAYPPLVQVVFTVGAGDRAPANVAGLSLQPLEVQTGYAIFDLWFELSPGPTGLKIAATYNRDLFESATIERLVGHFVYLVEAFIDQPDTKLTRLPLLDEAGRRRILIEWSGFTGQTAETLRANETVLTLVEKWVSRTPDAIALTYDHHLLSYRELNRLADCVADALRRHGVNQSAPVALCMSRGNALLVTMLGILKAGAAYLPMDKTHPLARRGLMLEDSGAKILLVDEDEASQLPEDITHLHYAQCIRPFPQPYQKTKLHGSSPAYLIYTSGSTGKPKGVIMTHGVVANLIARQIDKDSGRPRTLQYTAITFDVAFQEIFSTWSLGGTMISLDEAQRRDPFAMLKIMQAAMIERLFLPYVALRQLADAFEGSGTTPYALRDVVTAGERLRITPSIRGLFEELPNCRLHNHYGPSETHVITWHTLTGKAAEWPELPPIGRPVPGAQIYILGQELEPVPIGVAGALFAGGAAPACGYQAAPDLTAARFIPDPFSGEPGARLYVTGDVARFLPNGEIAFLGRSDDQVKIRGFRIEPAEIEAVLSKHDNVREAAVLVLQDRNGEPFLAAFIEQSAMLSNSEARAYLLGKLPDYMVPSVFLMIEKMPLTSTGKIDRRRLKELYNTQFSDIKPAAGEHAHNATLMLGPENAHEEMLADIFAAVLGLESISVTANFFELGGHSLLATRVISRAREAFGFEIPLQWVFEAPNVRAMAGRIQERSEESQNLPPITAQASREEYPLSFSQQRLWSLLQLGAPDAAYHIPAGLNIQGPLDATRLAQSLDQLIFRHAGTRTTFKSNAGEPTTVLHQRPIGELNFIDLSGIPAAQQLALGARFRMGLTTHHFDLEQGPLLRMMIVRHSRDHHELLLNMHHIISDGWSLGVMIHDLCAFYRGETLPPPALQYGDVAVWQRLDSVQHALAESENHWREALADAPELLLMPTDKPRPAIRRYRGETIPFQIDTALTESLRSLCRRTGATIFMVLEGLFALQLARYSGQETVVVGSPVANRGRKALEQLVGFFVNTLPLRNDLRGNPSFIQYLKRVRQTALNAYAHQDVPFERIVEIVNPGRDTRYNPIFQAFLVLQNTQEVPFNIPELKVSPIDFPFAHAKFDLSMEAREMAGGVKCSLVYDRDLFEAATAERFVHHFKNLLHAAVASPEAPIASLNMMDDRELTRVLVDWNQTEMDFGPLKCLHEYVFERAARNPDAVACVAAVNGVHWSYAALMQHAAGIAGHLLKLGIRAGDPVACLYQRTPEDLAAVLAIWRVGAVLVPLDPSHPAARLTYELTDAGVSAVLADASLHQRLPETEIPVLTPIPAQGITETIAFPPDYTAYIMYTSGSTGKPKGVTVPHRAMANRLCWGRRAHGLNSACRFLQIAAWSFDIALWEWLAPLDAGGCSILVPADAYGNPNELIRWTAEQRITDAHFVPSMLQALLNLPAFSGLNDLRRVYCGGEAVGVPLQQRFAELPQAQMIQFYGPTEAAINVIAGSCQGDRFMGRPIDNCTIYLLDHYGEPVPPGIIGEIYIGGENLADGYVGLADVTAAAFLPNRFSPSPGARLYRTGDLGCHDQTGRIAFAGRVDHQVKIRGFRVDPGEIEAVAASLDAVQEAVVQVQTAASGSKQLILLIASPLPKTQFIDRLQVHLQKMLPDYMRPNRIIVLAEFPRNANGKLDRKALKRLAENQEASLEPEDTPKSEPARVLAGIWRELLGLSREPGIRENFFELGGDSILGIQVSARARAAGYDIEPKHLFEHQTIEALANAAVPFITQELVNQEPVTGPLPLTPAQIDFFNLAGDAPNHFNQAILLKPRKHLQVPVLQQALDRLLTHHDALRTRFERLEGSWQATIADQGDSVPLEIHEVERDTDLEHQVKTVCGEAQTRFNLSHGNLIRAIYLSGPTSSRLALIIHHLVVDGVSWRILLDDLETLYTNLSADIAIHLPAKTASLQSWSERLHQANAISMNAAKEPDQPFNTPMDFPDSLVKNNYGNSQTVAVSLSATAAQSLLRETNAAYRTRTEEVLLTALALALCSWAKSDEIPITLEGHGRDGDFGDVSRTVGWFTAVYPVTLKPGDGSQLGRSLMTVKESLRAVNEAGQAHAGWTPNVITEGRKSQSFAAFNYLGQADQLFQARSLFEPAHEDTGPAQSPTMKRAHLLEINGLILSGVPRFEWRYCPEIHRRETIAALADNFITWLNRLIDHCSQPENAGITPSDFPLIQLNQTSLDGLPYPADLIEDVLPLAPLQGGLLFHARFETDRETYFEQFACTLRGPLDTHAYESAWRGLVARHSVLRTAFHWDDATEPVQVVLKQVDLPWLTRDWSKLSPQERDRSFEAYLAQDRAFGFDPTHAPLMRCTLIREDTETHRFVWSHHHLLLDGWSLPILLKDVQAAYNRLLNKSDHKTEPLTGAPSYKSYLSWLAARNTALDKSFWRDELAGLEQTTPLPLDRLQGTRRMGTRAAHSWSLAQTVTAQLTEASRGSHFTLSTVLQGSWAALLDLFAGQDEALFGVTVSGRPADLKDAERIAGLFINTIPARVKIQRDVNLGDWLQAIQARQMLRAEYAFLPLSEIRDQAPLAGPLFESLLVFENYPMQDGLLDSAGGPRITDIRLFEKTHFPLTLTAVPGETLQLRLDYDTSRFDHTLISELAERINKLLCRLPKSLTMTPSEWAGPSHDERIQLLNLGCADEAQPPAIPSITELFDQRAARLPNATALVQSRPISGAANSPSHLTYRELKRLADRLAAKLAAHGVAAETPVGVYMDRSPETTAALLAVLKAGGAWVPLPPEHPPAYLQYLIEDAGIRIVIADKTQTDKLPNDLTVLHVNAGRQIEESPFNNAPINTAGSAYIIYTSGSTGRPKGVSATHGATMNRFQWMWRTYPFAPNDRCCHKTSLAFVDSIWEIFGPLLMGVPAVVVSDAVLKDPYLLAPLLASERVTRLSLVPSLLRVLLELDAKLLKPLEQLRFWATSGEAPPIELVDRFKTVFPKARLLNLYGSSEVAADVTCCDLTLSSRQASAPIGRAITATDLFIVDAHMHLTPKGIPGQLLVGGANLARGYLDRPAETATAFVPDPFSGKRGARLYRTGDRVRYLPDDKIAYLGRVDHQVKLRGVRIELGALETMLNANPLVELATVVLSNAGQLTAFIQTDAEPNSVREALRMELPQAMVPERFVVLQTFPMTPSGKIDRQRLAAMEPTLNECELHREPETEMERLITELWAEVLEAPKIGLDDNFFALGGHSLSAMRLVSRIRGRTGHPLSVRELFAAPTPAQCAALLETNVLKQPLPPIEPIPKDQQAPMSFAQERLWFLDRLEGPTPSYNMPFAMRFQGRLSISALRRAANRVMARHEVLRTHFQIEDGTPVPSIIAEMQAPFALIDLQTLPEGDQTARKIMARAAAIPFDLTVAPLVSVMLFRLSKTTHFLFLNLHHIITDGWSMALLIRDIVEHYDLSQNALPPTIPAHQYTDYAAWQRTNLSGDRLAEQARYWREHLDGAPTAISLPLDHLRPVNRAYRGGSHAFRLEPSRYQVLQMTIRQLDVTLFMLLHAGFAELLHRYSRQSDLVIGSPVANRDGTGLETMIGLFVNTLALRTQIDESHCFETLLAKTKQTALAGYDHQEIPFEKVVEALQPDRGLAHTPIFQVQLVLQNAPMNTLSLLGLAVSPIGLDAPAAKFDLSLMVVERDPGLDLRFTYPCELFEADTISRMAVNFLELLENLIKEPNRPIATVPMLPEIERRRLLAWSKGETPANGEFPDVNACFEANAATHGDSPALIGDEGLRLTHGFLESQSNRIANRLRELGFDREEPIAMLFERSPEMILSMLSILKAGAPFLPIDPAFPDERIAFLLEDSGAGVILANASMKTRLKSFAGQVFDPSELLSASDHQPQNFQAGARAAYLIYTSGSTGRPKGVVVSRQALANYAGAFLLRSGLQPGGHFALASTEAADLGFTSIFGSLCSAGALHVLSHETATHGRHFRDYMTTRRIDCLKIVPSHLAALLDGEPQPATLPRKLLVLGGEAAPLDWVRKLQTIAPHCRILNHYGPTEATVGMLTHELQHQTGDGPLPLGRPLANTRVFVSNNLCEPSPVGVPGELLIGGAGLARGYLHRPHLTAERFTPDPFSGEAGARLYRSGDLARVLPNGEVVFLGRLDHQVKVRGYRVELAEIEHALRSHQSVQDAAVILCRQLPTAFAVACLGSSSSAILADYLAARLPAYMLPSDIVLLDALPRNANGKIDRHELAHMALHSNVEKKRAEPRTPTEKTLLAIWREILAREDIGVHDDFFQLGGHSLMATRVISRIEQRFGVELPLRELFTAPTPAELASRIEASRQNHLQLSLPPILPGNAQEARIPLSYSQRRLWFLNQMEQARGAGVAYHIVSVLQLLGPLSHQALERAISEVVRRHESLRTLFPANDGEPYQDILPPRAIRLGLLDLSGLTQTEPFMETLIREETAKPFNMAIRPLMRLKLIRLEKDRHVLVVTMHHIVSDGWSRGLLIRELSACYAAFALGREPALPPLPIQYSDFARWQQSETVEAALTEQLTYWRTQLAGAPDLLELPADYPRPTQQSFNGATLCFDLEPELIEALHHLSRSHGATLFMTLHAIFSVLLGRYAASEDVVVGTPVANRNRLETEPLIGCFINSLALRSDLSDNPSFTDFLAQIRQTALNAYACQDVPFERVVESVCDRRNLSRSPIFQVMFILQNAPMEDLAMAGLDLAALYPENRTAKFDLTLCVEKGRGRAACYFEYNTDLFKAETIHRMKLHWRNLLRGAAAKPQTRLAELPLLDADELQTLLFTWNETAKSFAWKAPLHQLFEARVAQSPEAAALLFDGGPEHLVARWSYAALNKEAERLAHHLRGLGIGPEARVGVCVHRSVEMVVGLLAILKAGACYVPLDPTYPTQRLAFMLSDAGMSTLLTTRALWRALEQQPNVSVVLFEEVPEQPTAKNSVTVDMLNPAYMIYTSGSTGAPKGAVNSHAAICNRLAWMQDAYPLGDNDRVLQKTPFSFDVSVWEFFWPLLTGAVLVVARPEGHRDPAYLVRTVKVHGITTIHFVPSMLRAFLCEDVSDLGGLRRVFSSGEALSRDLVTRFHQHLNAELHNLYGPTEAAIDVTFQACRNLPANGCVPIGKPIANTSIYVTDQYLGPVPRGVTGELLIGGVNLGRGYHNRPDLTAARFVPCPFGPQSGARVYRTGDRVRHLPDGAVEFIGRLDHQLKLRGFRIELGEIETRLRDHQEVVDCAVIAHGKKDDDLRLIAYVIPRKAYGSDQTSREQLHQILKPFLREHLPEHMVPADFLPLARFPLSPNGKLDRNALPEPERIGPTLQTHVAPRNPMEEALAHIWRDVLDLPCVGVFDNFFEIGGHSLSATKVIARLRVQFEVDVPLHYLFQEPTIARLAEVLDNVVATMQGAPPDSMLEEDEEELAI